VQSLRDSSFDSWIKFYRPDENANNSRISYYVKGSLVGMLLDTKIRSNTDDQKSLDDVMRLLWNTHRETGYTNEDFAAAVAEVCDDSVKKWLEDVLDSTNELEYDELLEWYGLEWKLRDSDKEKDKENEKEPADERPVYGNVYVGLDLKAEQGRAMVDKVTRDSPASMSGILVGDELISFDGFRITTEVWNERLNLYKPDDVCKCLIARRGKILELQIRLAVQPENGWTLVRVAKPTENQEAHWRAWLHMPLVESDAP
jgi:predicted metalloprotease with PDZ domain